MKFSIITPVYNGQRYISETIESVLSQEGNFEVEYIIIDGASTDKTVDIIKTYQQRISVGDYPIYCKDITLRWYSEEDSGMYHAINKGFLSATGDIYAWLNSDDTYLPGAFSAVAKTFARYHNIRWLTGMNSLIDESSRVVKTNPCYIYNQEWIRLGIYGRNAYFIHQESVFWRNELWKKISGIDERFKLAGDYYLWVQFSKLTPLWSLNIPTSCFRKRENQLSDNTKSYRREQLIIACAHRNWLTFRIRLFFWLKLKLPLFFERVLLLLYRVLFPSRNKRYVKIKNDSVPMIIPARSFIA